MSSPSDAPSPGLASPPRDGKGASSLVQARLQQFSAVAAAAAAPTSPTRGRSVSKLSPAAAPLPPPADKDVPAAAALPVASPSAAPVPESSPAENPTATSTTSSTAPVTSRPRRNSAPKGSVHSLLSFWRDKEVSQPAPGPAAGRDRSSTTMAVMASAAAREHAAQDQRLVRQQQAILEQRDAQAASHTKALATALGKSASSTSSKGADAVSAGSVLSSSPTAPPALSPAPSTLSPMSPAEADLSARATAQSADASGGWHSSASSCTSSNGSSGSGFSADSVLSLPPATTALMSMTSSPAVVEGLADSLAHEDLHGSPELQGNRVVSDPLPRDSHASSASASSASTPVAHIAVPAVSSPSDTDVAPTAAAAGAAAFLPSPPSMFTQPNLSRCITDFGQDGGAGSTETAVAGAPHHQLHPPHLLPHNNHHSHPTHLDGRTLLYASGGVASSAPPLLTREITDPLSHGADFDDDAKARSRTDSAVSAAAGVGTGAIGTGGSTASLPPPLQREVTDFSTLTPAEDHAHAVYPSNAGVAFAQVPGVPSLRRDITDLGAEQAALHKEQGHQQQQHIASASLPPLSRLATDPEHDDGAGQASSLFPAATTTAAAQKVISPPPLMARVHTEVDMAAMARHADAQETEGQHVKSSPPPLMTRVATEMNMALAAGSTPDASAPVPSPAPLMTRVLTEMNMHARAKADEEGEPSEEDVLAAPGSQGRLATGTPLQRLRTDPLDTPGGAQLLSGNNITKGDSADAAHAVSPLAMMPLQRHVTDVVSATAEKDDEDESSHSGRSSAPTEAADSDAEEAQDEPRFAEEEQDTKIVAPHARHSRRSSAEVAAEEGSDSVSSTLPGERLSLSISGADGSMLSPTPSTPSSLEREHHARTPSAYGFQPIMSLPPPTPLAVVQALQSPVPMPLLSPALDAAQQSSSTITEPTTAVSPSATASSAPALSTEERAALASQRSFRAKVEAELLSTEESYVSSLGLLVSHFIHPLKNAAEGLHVSAGQIGLIFSNVELLYNFHCIFLHDLQAAVKASQKAAAAAEAAEAAEAGSPNSSAAPVVPAPLSDAPSGAKSKVPLTVSELFLKLGDFMKMYTSYLAGYSVALDTIASLRNNSKFTSFLLNCRAEAAAAAAVKNPGATAATAASAGQASKGGKPGSSGLDLMSYLIMPVQRIPRYLLLLKELLRFTGRGHPELERLQLAFNKVQKIAQHINEQQRHVENMSVLLSIQNAIDGASLKGVAFGNLMAPTRRLLRTGILHKVSSGLLANFHVRRVYLFNDLLLWCETSAAAAEGAAAGATGSNSGSAGVGTSAEKFSGFASLDGLNVSEFVQQQKGGSSRFGFKFTVSKDGKSSGKGKTKEHSWLCRSVDEQKSWMGDIRAAQDALKEAGEEARKRRSDSTRAMQQPDAVASPSPSPSSATSASSDTTGGTRARPATMAVPSTSGAPLAAAYPAPGAGGAPASIAEEDAEGGERRVRANSF